MDIGQIRRVSHDLETREPISPIKCRKICGSQQAPWLSSLCSPSASSSRFTPCRNARGNHHHKPLADRPRFGSCSLQIPHELQYFVFPQVEQGGGISACRGYTPQHRGIFYDSKFNKLARSQHMCNGRRWSIGWSEGDPRMNPSTHGQFRPILYPTRARISQGYACLLKQWASSPPPSLAFAAKSAEPSRTGTPQYRISGEANRRPVMDMDSIMFH